MLFLPSKNKGRILLLFPKNGPTFGKILFFLVQNFKYYDCSKIIQVVGTNGGRQPIS
jgi:hypothetical protein